MPLTVTLATLLDDRFGATVSAPEAQRGTVDAAAPSASEETGSEDAKAETATIRSEPAATVTTATAKRRWGPRRSADPSRRLVAADDEVDTGH